MLVEKLDFRCLYMVFKFFSNLDSKTRIFFNMHEDITCIINYIRLILSIIIPRRIFLATLPRLAFVSATYKLNHTVQAFAYLTIKRNLMKCFESEVGIVVNEKFRRSGIGNMLLKALIDQAKRTNVTKISANVSSDNVPAINFFKKNGFSIALRIKDTKTEHASRYIMALNLNSQSKK